MKKPSVVSFLITLMLAAAVCIQGNEPEEVKDRDGNPVELANQYFIQPVKTERNNGGGLVPATAKIFPLISCPLVVTQTILPLQPGVPVRFALPLSEAEVISTSSVFLKLWKVNDSSSASKEPAIIIDGTTPQAQNSQFKIEKAATGENTYKLISVTGAGTVGAIRGRWFDAPQLVLTNDDAKIIAVKFKKADDATTVTTSTSRVEKLGLKMFPFY
ncbi:hypothetical protein CARUB_v10021379mg [Capsella rubella]|uniref:Uncharacterized protein n=1 Tax=Capsella rubella TaxID=81985 RepID=R0GDL7_9BRAS|nr:hypothetical protein CARUB_v10021379mg [Capsella rubella]